MTHRLQKFGLVVAATLMGGMVPGVSELIAQERLGRQQGLTTQERQALQSQVTARGGRVIIGFKPVTAASGMRPDGAPALSPQEVGVLSVGVLQTLSIPVSRQFSLIPAVTAVVTPQQLDALLTNPSVENLQPEVLYATVGVQSKDRRVQDE